MRAHVSTKREVESTFARVLRLALPPPPARARAPRSLPARPRTWSGSSASVASASNRARNSSETVADEPLASVPEPPAARAGAEPSVTRSAKPGRAVK